MSRTARGLGDEDTPDACRKSGEVYLAADDKGKKKEEKY